MYIFLFAALSKALATLLTYPYFVLRTNQYVKIIIFYQIIIKIISKLIKNKKNEGILNII